MAVRTTAAEVGKIVEVDASITDLTPFINAANELVTELCSDSGYSTTRLGMIETWLSAHFYAIRDMRPATETAGSVSASYQHRVDLNLAATMYGQQAMLLDTAGNLASLNITAKTGGGRGTVGVVWLGSEE